MNRTDLQQLANDRIADVEALLAAHRWAGAYHMAGYALECALKSCVLHHIEKTGVIFSDKKYLDALPKCWTHDLSHLLNQTGLMSDFGEACKANPILYGNWGVAKDWTEVSRYQQKNQAEAEELFKAITNVPNGVLPWIQIHW